MELPIPSRRQFLTAVANLASVSWVTVNWPQIALAADGAEHAGHDMSAGGPTELTTLSPAEAAEVDAIANLIIPGGATPGARDARVLYFIDNSLGSFWAAQLPSFKQGITEFATAFAASPGATTIFSAAPEAQQIAFLETVDETPFFLAVRRLSVLGLLALPKYGGNTEYIGWNLIGVENRHIWVPPFGYYDQEAKEFEPYPGTTPYTA